MKKLTKLNYSLQETHHILKEQFQGWGNIIKLRGVFVYNKRYECKAHGTGPGLRWTITRNKLELLIEDIKTNTI